MGSAFGCLRGDNFGDQLQNHNSSEGCSFCLQWSIQPLLNVYGALFQRGQARISPLAEQRTASLSNTFPEQDNSSLDTYRSPPRPLAYDDPRCSQLLQRQVSRRSKSFPGPHESSESLLRIGSPNLDDLESLTKEKCYGSSIKLSADSEGDVANGEDDTCTSSEDEEDCPICLEEYTSENPKMVLQCNHHFHLSCIYEWMERSEACPVCGKVMLFNENT